MTPTPGNVESRFRMTVPHLTTALTGPLQKIEADLLQNQAGIERWFRSQWRQTPAPFYSSVDLRNAGFKLAPVDTNLFPGGFNNLNPAFESLAVQAVQAALERICPSAGGVLVIPENHTRNTYYFENLAALTHILAMAGLRVRLGSLMPDLREPRIIELPSSRRLTLEPLIRRDNRITVEGFEPCFVLLNNDLSGQLPAILDKLEQPVVPHVSLGWWNRLKSRHFSHYRQIAREFAELIALDPWLIDPVFRKCGKINFEKREGEECLANYVDEVLGEVRVKYREYAIDQEPFVIVKADAGTYGMAIMTVKSADEVRGLNRKQRTKMSHLKEGQAVHDVMVQEGVYTFETWGAKNAVAEPVVYMIDHYVIGGFYRVHTERRPDENLNSPGMHFEPLAFAGPCCYPDPQLDPDSNPNRFYAYGVIARLASLAAAREATEVAELLSHPRVKKSNRG